MLLFLLLLCSNFVFSQSNILQGIYTRKTTSLNGYWKTIIDPYENGFYNYRYKAFDQSGIFEKNAFYSNTKPIDKSDLIEYDFDTDDSLMVPGDWNTQKKELYYYEGSVWYRRTFDYNKSSETNRVFVYFEGANYATDIYFNGIKLGQHHGGFTPFNYEITSLLKESGNFLIVKVDNKRYKEAVPTINTDWWNYGGLTRGVKLVELPNTFIDDYSLKVNRIQPDLIEGYCQIIGNNKENQILSLEIPELGISLKIKSDIDGIAKFQIASKKINYWSPDNPHLYNISFISDADTVHDKIGFRTIETSGTSILLNKKRIFLKGISIHEESTISKGRANSREDALQLLSWAKELGCNYVRLAHYPHNEHMVRLADQMGIMVWEEIPVYWTIAWENVGTLQNASKQLTDLVQRDKNRAATIIWSVANETPASPERNAFLGHLVDLAKKMDDSRLISAALEQTNFEGNPLIRTIEDPFAYKVDLLSFNQYIGWYDGLPSKCKDISWNIKLNKPVIISEFGAGAKYGLHGDYTERWTEEYQANLYTETIAMVKKIPQLAGISPWILVDFRSPRRLLPNIQDDFNRKGLISEKGEKKQAFFILQEFYKSK